MQPLEALIADATRQLEICNACRYCEGYCAVFPALERRELFLDGDVVFLANLCHDCSACYQACMYTSPHEFAVDVPQVLASVRQASYRRLAWPARLAVAFERPFAAQLAALALGVTVVLAVVAASGDFGESGSFYRVMPAAAMESLFLALAGLALAALAGSFGRFMRLRRSRTAPLSGRAVVRAALDILLLRFLGGGGGGCYYPRLDEPRHTRRLFHQLVFYGFALTFASTVSAAVEQHLFDRLPPYPLTSLPVVLGLAGGVAIVVGGAAMLVDKRRAQPLPGKRLDYAFLAALEIAAVTGIVLLVFRSTGAMAPILIVHLASVVAFFALIPYSKFVHASHRMAALLVDAAEREAS